MVVFERIIRVTGFRPTNYPFMSFDGDSVSRYYSAMSGPQTPAAQLRALVRTYPSALVGYSGGVDSALLAVVLRQELGRERMLADRKSTRLNSSHVSISYAVFCLKKQRAEQ